MRGWGGGGCVMLELSVVIVVAEVVMIVIERYDAGWDS